MRRLFAIVALLIAVEVHGATLKETFAAGETLDFDLSWSLVSGGAARMTIAPIGDDRFRLTSVGKSGTFFSRFFFCRFAFLRRSLVGSRFSEQVQDPAHHEDKWQRGKQENSN